MSINIFWKLHILLLLFLLLPLPLRAAVLGSGGVELEVVPQTLNLESCEKSVPLLIIVRNSTDQAASNLKISSFSDVPIELSHKPTLTALASRQQKLWQFKIRCTSDFSSGLLHIVLSDKLKSSDGVWQSQIATQSVAVKLREPQTLESIAAIDIKSTLESLRQTDKGELRVTVANKTMLPIKVTILPQMPSFIELKPKNIDDTQIDPLRTVSFPFTVSAMERVRPGKQLLIFQVQIATEPGKRDFLITHEVNVGVLGESEILKLLGVPSLLFLPGFLAVSSFMLLWRWKLLRPEENEAPPPLEATTSGFWVVSILVSLVIGYALIKFRDDFFSFYGLGDLMIVWGMSIGIGCLAYWGYRMIANANAAKKESERLINIPQPTDTPLQILRKLKIYEKKMLNKKVKVKKMDGLWFILLQDGINIYVCQPMGLIWNEEADEVLVRKVTDQLTADGDPGIVADALEPELAKKKGGEYSSIKELDWLGTDSQHVLRLEQTDIESGQPDYDIILCMPEEE
jgi:hypothetical protein